MFGAPPLKHAVPVWATFNMYAFSVNGVPLVSSMFVYVSWVVRSEQALARCSQEQREQQLDPSAAHKRLEFIGKTVPPKTARSRL